MTRPGWRSRVGRSREFVQIWVKSTSWLPSIAVPDTNAVHQPLPNSNFPPGNVPIQDLVVYHSSGNQYLVR